MTDILWHMLGGAVIALVSTFFLPDFTLQAPGMVVLLPLSAFVSAAIYGLLREQAQHGTDFFDFSWVTASRLLEGVAWGFGAALLAVLLVI